MSFKTILCSCACLLLLVTPFASAIQNSPSVIQQVSDAARDGLQTYLAKIPAGLEKNYGFSNRAEFKKTTLGRPYHQVIMDAADGSIEVVDTWRVPIQVSGRSQALLTVAKQKGVWKVVEIGAAKLAADLGKLETEVIRGKPNLQVAIIRVFKLRSDFVAVAPAKAQIESGDFHPLLSAQTFLELNRSQKFNYGQLKTLLAQKLSNQ